MTDPDKQPLRDLATPEGALAHLTEASIGVLPRTEAEACRARVEDELARLEECAQFAGVPAWTKLWLEKEAAEAKVDRLKKIETKYNTVVGAVRRGNFVQARIWCGLTGEDAAYANRFDNAQARAAEAASEWCWNATPETEAVLRDAVAEWRTALGLWKLQEREKTDDRS